MAQWVPPANIGDNEQIGRRLFDEPLLVSVSKQPSYTGLLLTHFEETRGEEVSVDRLGRTGVEKRVAAFLKPRAMAAGQKFTRPKKFDGWSTISARELRKVRRNRQLNVVSSPVSEPAPNDNPYHAHIDRLPAHDSHSMALHLRHIFATFGDIERAESGNDPNESDTGINRKAAWYDIIMTFIGSLISSAAGRWGR